MKKERYPEYPEEKATRRDISEAGRRMYMRGMVCANDGNLSARISGGAIIATPTGVSKGFMSEEMLVKLDLEGNILEGETEPSSEIRMHLAIYNKNPGIRAVCHAHPPVSAAFAAAGVPLDKPLLQETVVSLGVIPVAKYEMPGTEELAKTAAGFCTAYYGVLLEHHGAVTWGDSVLQALFRMESLEHAATVLMHSAALGFDRPMDKEQVDRLLKLRDK